MRQTTLAISMQPWWYTADPTFSSKYIMIFLPSFLMRLVWFKITFRYKKLHRFNLVYMINKLKYSWLCFVCIEKYIEDRDAIFEFFISYWFTFSSSLLLWELKTVEVKSFNFQIPDIINKIVSRCVLFVNKQQVINHELCVPYKVYRLMYMMWTQINRKMIKKFLSVYLHITIYIIYAA